jgi:hypothetical protein
MHQVSLYNFIFIYDSLYLVLASFQDWILAIRQARINAAKKQEEIQPPINTDILDETIPYRRLRMKLLQFSENVRPAYYGK